MTQENPVNFESKMELQTNVIAYAKEKYNTDPLLWAESYSDYFREICDDQLIEEYKSYYDKNPEELYEKIQKTLDEMFKLHHH